MKLTTPTNSCPSTPWKPMYPLVNSRSVLQIPARRIRIKASSAPGTGTPWFRSSLTSAPFPVLTANMFLVQKTCKVCRKNIYVPLIPPLFPVDLASAVKCKRVLIWSLQCNQPACISCNLNARKFQQADPRFLVFMLCSELSCWSFSALWVVIGLAALPN